MWMFYFFKTSVPFSGRCWNIGGRKQPVLPSRRRFIRHWTHYDQLQRRDATSGGSRPAATLQAARFIQHWLGSDPSIGESCAAYFFQRRLHFFRIRIWRRAGFICQQPSGSYLALRFAPLSLGGRTRGCRFAEIVTSNSHQRQQVSLLSFLFSFLVKS